MLALHQEVEKGNQEHGRRSPRRQQPQLWLGFSSSHIASQAPKSCLLSVLYRSKVQGADKSGPALRSRMIHVPRGCSFLYITSSLSPTNKETHICLPLWRSFLWAWVEKRISHGWGPSTWNYKLITKKMVFISINPAIWTAQALIAKRKAPHLEEINLPL